MGVMWVTHSFSTTSVRIRHNTETYIVLGAQGDDLRALAETLGTTREQTEKLRVLQPGEVVALAPGAWPAAVYGRFPFVPAQADEVLLQEQAERFLRQVRAEPGGRQAPAKKPDTLSAEQLRLLIEAAFHATMGVTVLYERAGLERMGGRKAMECLHGRGLVRPQKVSSGQRGGRITLLEVTDEGWKELSGRGFDRPARVTRGGFLHNAAAEALGELGRKQSYEVQYERSFDGVFVDVTWQSRDGDLICHQIGLSSAKWEVANIRKLLNAGGVNEVVLVGRDRAFLRKAWAGLRGQLTAEEEKKVRLCCMGEILNQVQ